MYLLFGTGPGRVECARQSSMFFMRYYMGGDYYSHQERWLTIMDGLGPGGRFLLLAPRSHGKTETATSYILRRVALDRNIRILIVTMAADAAKKRLRRLKQHLEGNTKLIEDFGPFKPEKAPKSIQGITEVDEATGNRVQIGYWTERYVYVRRDADKPDPTIEAIGVGGAITGGRFDLIFFDDPVDYRQSLSPTEREKVREEIYGTYLELLEPWGQVICLGTRKHEEDIYQTFINDPRFRVVHDRAVVKWPEAMEPVYEVEAGTGRKIVVDFSVTGTAEVLCPEMWPFARPTSEGESLMSKFFGARDSGVSTAMFLRELQNEIDPGQSEFFPKQFFFGGTYQPSPKIPARVLKGCLDTHRSWLSGVYPQGVQPHHLGLDDDADLVVYQCWDLSILADKKKAEKKDTDWTVGFTVVLDRRTWTRYLVGAWRDRGLTPAIIRQTITHEFHRFGGLGNVQAVVIESVLFQAVYVLDMQQFSDLPVTGHSTGAEKADPTRGIPALSALHEHGKMRYPYATEPDQRMTDAIVRELQGYPTGKHDDMLMALFIGEQQALAIQNHALFLEERARRMSGRPVEHVPSPTDPARFASERDERPEPLRVRIRTEAVKTLGAVLRPSGGAFRMDDAGTPIIAPDGRAEIDVFGDRDFLAYMLSNHPDVIEVIQ